MDLDTVTQLARWIFLCLGIGVIVWALFLRDRAKGRRRCPKCWYDMSATDGMTCPECGREQKRERRFGRTRRSWRRAVVGVALLVVSYAAHVGPDVHRGGWMFAVPRTALILSLPMIETPSTDVVMQYETDIGYATGWGVVRGAEPRPTLSDRAVLHLYLERLGTPELFGWQYKLVRDDFLRRASGDDSEWFVREAFMYACPERALRDETLLPFEIRKSIGSRFEQDNSLLCVFRPWSGLLHEYVITINGDHVYHPSIWDEVLAVGSTFNEELLRKPFRVPLHGADRGVLRVRAELPESSPVLGQDGYPEVIEFEFTLDDLPEERFEPSPFR